VPNVGRSAIWRTPAAYLKGGLDFALHIEPRPGQPKRCEADVEAQVTALACSDPPPGGTTLINVSSYALPVFSSTFQRTLSRTGYNVC
jgi:hypothetical protein